MPNTCTIGAPKTKQSKRRTGKANKCTNLEERATMSPDQNHWVLSIRYLWRPERLDIKSHDWKQLRSRPDTKARKYHLQNALGDLHHRNWPAGLSAKYRAICWSVVGLCSALPSALVATAGSATSCFIGCPASPPRTLQFDPFCGQNTF